MSDDEDSGMPIVATSYLEALERCRAAETTYLAARKAKLEADNLYHRAMYELEREHQRLGDAASFLQSWRERVEVEQQ